MFKPLKKVLSAKRLIFGHRHGCGHEREHEKNVIMGANMKNEFVHDKHVHNMYIHEHKLGKYSA